MSSVASDHGLAADGAALAVHYLSGADAPRALHDPRTLALIAFDADADADANVRLPDADGRCLRVPLQPLGASGQAAPLECWTAAGTVVHGVHAGIRHASDGALQLLALEVEERGDIRAAARAAYQRIVAFAGASACPHVLRMWNYFDAITEGEGDAERYRQFCIGRAEGIAGRWREYPAATAIGSRTGAAPQARMLQVYALCARAPGQPLENPRQVSAYRYPRQYGPQPPSFARAMLPGGAHMPLLLSGTASVVGHASAHPDCVLAQLEETCVNLERLLATARERMPDLPECYGRDTRLKVYLREPAHADAVAAGLARRFPGVDLLVLAADVCRSELRVEVDGFHGPGLQEPARSSP